MIAFPKPPTGTSPQAAWYRQLLDAVMRRNVIQIEGFQEKQTTDGRVFQKIFGVTPVAGKTLFPFQISQAPGKNMYQVNGGAVEVRVYFDNTGAPGVYDINQYQNLHFVGNPPYGTSSDSIYNPVLDLTAAFNGGVAGTPADADIYLTIAQDTTPNFKLKIEAFPTNGVGSSQESFFEVSSYSTYLIGRVLNPAVFGYPPANWTASNPGNIIQCVRSHITGQYFASSARYPSNDLGGETYLPTAVYYPGDIVVGSDGNTYILAAFLTSVAAPKTGAACSLGIDPTAAAPNNYWAKI